MMIQNTDRWREFENAWIASQKPDYAQNLRLVDGMYDLARKLGRFQVEDALEGVENTIALVAKLNRVRNTP
jgi:hypothetical protein